MFQHVILNDDIACFVSFNLYELEPPFMHVTDCCWFLISTGIGGGGGCLNLCVKLVTKIAGSGSVFRSGSISYWHESADPALNLDPHQNVMDPQHCQQCNSRVHKTTYAPMIYTFFDAALRGEVGPKLHLLLGPTSPCNASARIKKCINHSCIGSFMNTRIALRAVLQIHDILVLIWLQGWIRRFMPLTNGSRSEYGSGSCYFCH